MNARSMRVLVASGVILAVAASTATAQDQARTCRELELLQQTDPGAGSYFEKQFCAKVKSISDAKTTNPAAGVDLRRDFFFFVFALVSKSGRAQYIVEAEESRVDKQIGSDPGGNAGSTSLVVKGGVPSILGLAVENGALTQDFNGTTITFRGSPLGMVKAFANKGFIEAYDQDRGEPARFFKGISFALSFDTSRGDQAGIFVGSRQQLSAYSLRYELYNKRDPRNATYERDWDGFLSTAAQSLTNQIATSIQALTNVGDDPPPANPAWLDPALQRWYETLQSAVAGASADGVEKTFKDGLDAVPFSELSEPSRREIEKLNLRIQGYLALRETILGKVARGGIITFEYTNYRGGDGPSLSNLRLIAETGLGGKVDVTANASLTLFNSKPTEIGVGRVRDFRLAAQIDVPVGDVRGFGEFNFSFAGRYERLLEDATTPSGIRVAGTAGNLAFGQLKLTIPVRGSGVRIPMSMTFANRTEFIKEREVRGNVGITFDLDSIFARLRP